MGKTIRKSLRFILHVELGGINIMRRYIGILIIIILMSLTGCEAEELPKRLFLEKINVVLEKGIETVESLKKLSNNEEEYERIFISDTQFVEIHFDNMNLPKNILDNKVDDEFHYDYYKKDIEKMILNEEMAKEVAWVFLKPYFNKFLGENIYFSVQYIPDYGYYFVYLNEWASAFGYSVELVLDEKDGRVVYLWDIDPSLG